jgi:hypothetical protein
VWDGNLHGWACLVTRGITPSIAAVKMNVLSVFRNAGLDLPVQLSFCVTSKLGVRCDEGGRGQTEDDHI